MACERIVAFAVLVALLVVVVRVDAGHESPFYPSYYPQEIRVESVSSAAAGPALQRASIHAFLGGDPYRGRTTPANVASVESLGAYVVVTLNTASPGLGDRERRCALATRLIRTLARNKGKYISHPYPVTPYHMDYLEHFDLAESSKLSAVDRPGGEGATASHLKISAKGELASDLVRAAWPLSTAGWDARVETIDVDELLAPHAINLNGWLGPPWLKEGWFHAYLLLGGSLVDRSVKAEVDQTYRRLIRGEYGGLEEKVNLERAFVSLLRSGCERVVVGYTLRRAYFNSDYSQGVENIAYDSDAGANSHIFMRTVKLKDFMWNGWLRIGVAGKPVAAWNPLGGFGDAFGRLLWSAVGDPALLPGPYGGGWIPNRVSGESWTQKLQQVLGPASAGGGSIAVPASAWIPQPGSGMLQRVGEGLRADEKVEYRVLESSFHDGTPMTVADVLYPYMFAFRWGGGATRDAGTYDGYISTSTALMRQSLVGIKVLTTLKVVKDLGGDLKLRYEVPVIDVYLHHATVGPEQVAAVAPPWSTVPWHLVVLMEEAVQRRVGAFSAEEAARRRVPWLDLVRQERIKAQLARLVSDFAARGYVPESLKELVTVAEARQRWRALGEFYRQYGHFLVTNGPYRLQKWSGDGVVLAVFRDLSYPLGVGSFDRYAWPRKAYITRLSVQGARLEIHADVERLLKYERSYKIVREPLGSNASGAIDTVSPVSRLVVVRGDGRVVKVAAATYGNHGVATADLRDHLSPGAYRVMVSVYLNDNYLNPDVKVISYQQH
jgi:hypothetical protein